MLEFSAKFIAAVVKEPQGYFLLDFSKSRTRSPCKFESHFHKINSSPKEFSWQLKYRKRSVISVLEVNS